MPAKWRELTDQLYTIQVAVEDCTGLPVVRRGLPGQGQEQRLAQGA